MFYLKKLLNKYGTINVSVVGTGLMGISLVTQLNLLDNFSPRVVSSRRITSVLSAYERAGVDKNLIKIAYDFDSALSYFNEGFFIATTDSKIAASLGDCVVDCTGDTEEGVKICLQAMESGVDIVSLNVEMDATVGPYLKVLSDRAGVVYSGTAGDEPGAIMELYEFAKFSGFEVLVLGKGKNNKLNNYITNEDVKEEAKSKNLNPRMLTSFIDGTNTMVELNAVCNATGFVPDVRGCHYFKTDKENLASDIDLVENGSKLNSYGVVDFASGVAPGVFAIIGPKAELISAEMKFLSMGVGPNFALYRPYHLTSIETPISIARAVLLKDSTIAPTGKPVAETITIAKRDLKAGEIIGGIGSDDIFGVLEKAQIQKEENLLPIGLVVGKVKMLKDVKKATPIKYEDVCLEENSEIVKIRRRQDKFWVD